jgi:hypothetical protein
MTSIDFDLLADIGQIHGIRYLAIETFKTEVNRADCIHKQGSQLVHDARDLRHVPSIREFGTPVCPVCEKRKWEEVSVLAAKRL